MDKRILVTLGPSSLSEEVVRECTEIGGVYVFRINLSHTPLEAVEPTIKKIQGWTDVPVCLDSEGAQIRNQNMVSEEVAFTDNSTVKIHFDEVTGDSENISFSPAGSARLFEVGDEIAVDFNHVRFRVDDLRDDHCLATVIHGGCVGSNKAADLNRDIPLDPLTEKDRKAIQIGRENELSHFALSFTNRREDILEMRKVSGPDATIICKIESPSALLNLESILEEADQVLIDRGDLSRRIDIKKIPFLQRRIISSARSKRTPVFVATNLLESMVKQKSPTRAEVNDVVSTLLMGADGLVLAAETAIGGYPVDAVRMIRSLIDECEMWTPNTSIADIVRA